MTKSLRFDPEPAGIDLYAQQQAMAANIGRLKSKNAKRQQARMLVRSLVKRAMAR